MRKNESPLFLGIDIGSSGIKGLLLDLNSGIQGTATFSVDLFSEHPGFAEADTGQWWNGIKSIVDSLVIAKNISPDSIKAISFTGMVPAILFLDKDRKPLRRAILQSDARAFSEIEILKSALAGIDLLSKIGSSITQQSVAPTVAWMAKNQPLVLSSTEFIVGSYDWAAIALGAIPHVESNWALESGLYNWDGSPAIEVIDAVPADWPQLLAPLPSGTSVGHVSESAAQELGLSTDTEIIVGGSDTVLSAYGAGLMHPGDALVKLGGAGDIMVVSDNKVLDKRLYLDLYPIPGKWLPNGCMATSGSLLRWEQKIFGGVGLQILDAEAEISQPGNLLVLPYFLGEKSPHHDPNLRGAILGLHLGTSRGDIHRSLLEAIAFGFREHLEIFNSIGIPVGVTKVTNGGSKSRLWRTILSDVLQTELISIIDHPGASFGAAVIGGIGSKYIKEWDFVDEYLEQGEIISPNSKNGKVYQERFNEFLDFKRKTDVISHSLAKSQNLPND
jgi:xylulokinase